MSLRITTSDPQELLRKIKLAIDEKRIVTWRYILHNNSDYFTHATPDKQWDAKAWFKPTVKEGDLLFNIIRPEGKKVSAEVYAIYHGRFLEMMLAHFDKDFSNCKATALAEDSDLV